MTTPHPIVAKYVERYNLIVAKAEDERQAALLARQAKENAEALEDNRALRARMQTDLPAEVLVLADHEPEPCDRVSLRLGTGWDYLTVRWADNRKQKLELVFDPGPRERKERVTLPVSTDEVVECVARAWHKRTQDMQAALENWSSWLARSADEWSEDDVHERARSVVESWPDLAEKVEWMTGKYLADRRERKAQRAMREAAAKAQAEAEAQAQRDEYAELLQAIKADPLARALLRAFIAAQDDRANWREAITEVEAHMAEAQSAAEHASYLAERASERAAQAEAEADRASRNAQEASFRADDAETKVRKLERGR